MHLALAPPRVEARDGTRLHRDAPRLGPRPAVVAHERGLAEVLRRHVDGGLTYPVPDRRAPEPDVVVATVTTDCLFERAATLPDRLEGVDPTIGTHQVGEQQGVITPVRAHIQHDIAGMHAGEEHAHIRVLTRPETAHEAAKPGCPAQGKTPSGVDGHASSGRRRRRVRPGTPPSPSRSPRSPPTGIATRPFAPDTSANPATNQ